MAEYRLLIVDDEPDICRMVERIFSRTLDVTTSTDPVEALAWIRGGRRFDLIISDVMMPRLTGLELLAAIDEIDPAQAERLAFLTASVLTSELEQTFAGIPNTVLRKPIALADLRAFVGGRLAPH